MTNNHCPKIPARILVTRKTESDVHDFAVKIMNQITEFAENQSMDEMIILVPGIADNWTECPRCESLICETQGRAYGMVIKQIMEYLESEF